MINRYTRRPFAEDEVYVFSVVLCDNDIDRDFERFTVEALFQLEKLFVGKTGIYDHNPKAKNQTARIFDCTVQAVEGRKTRTGDDYFRLVARAYMPRCKSTEDVILQIESGIRKEVSVGCAASKAVCSVCGAERGSVPCGHIRGESYGNVLCYFELSDVTDAYEWSFVAVPAQREAGVIKGFYSEVGKEFLNMNEIIKSLSMGDAVTLCVDDAKKLHGYITELEAKAAQGEEYRKELSEEVLRLSAVTQPGISRKTMESVLRGLSTAELKEFAQVYREKAKGKMLPKAQLAPKNPASTSAGNKEFTI